MAQKSGERSVRCDLDRQTHVGTVEIQRPPNNFLNIEVLRDIVAALAGLDDDPGCRAIVLRAAGKHFCAGRDFSAPRLPGDEERIPMRTGTAALLALAVPAVVWLVAFPSRSGAGP